MKKAQQMELNWIYILVVGGVFLGLFVMIFTKTQAGAKEEYKIDAKNYIYNMITSSETLSMGDTQIELSDITLEFACNQLAIGQNSVSTEQDIIFSPTEINTEMYAQAAYFSPVKTLLLTSLTGKNIVYIFDGTEKPLFLDLPSRINKKLVNDLSEFKNENYENIRVISSGMVPANRIDSKNLEEKRISLVKIEVLGGADTFPESFGKATYYIKKNGNFANIGEAYFSDRSSLFAAIVSENAESYNCQMEKAIEKLNLIYKIRKNRLEEFMKIKDLRHCPYTDSISIYTSLIDYTNNKKPDMSTMQSLYSSIAKLEEANDVLKRLSCPEIY
jgi:hypothetical protein